MRKDLWRTYTGASLLSLTAGAVAAAMLAVAGGCSSGSAAGFGATDAAAEATPLETCNKSCQGQNGTCNQNCCNPAPCIQSCEQGCASQFTACQQACSNPDAGDGAVHLGDLCTQTSQCLQLVLPAPLSAPTQSQIECSPIGCSFNCAYGVTCGAIGCDKTCTELGGTCTPNGPNAINGGYCTPPGK